MTDQTLTLAESLDMNAAGPLHKEFLARRGKPVTLDASQVRRIGGQCLQVLLAAQTAWAADGAEFQITEPSTEFSDGLTLMGASHLAPATALSPVQD